MDPVEIALKKFETHPSVIDIKRSVTCDSMFTFSKVTDTAMEKELLNEKTKKASTFLNIPVKHIKLVVDIILQPLVKIWNTEIVENQKFPFKLKNADIKPIFKVRKHLCQKL